MEIFSALLAICAGNSLVTGEFPAQRPVTRSFDVFFDLRLNKRLSKQSWCWWFETPSHPLWCHCNDGEANETGGFSAKRIRSTQVDLIWFYATSSVTNHFPASFYCILPNYCMVDTNIAVHYWYQSNGDQLYDHCWPRIDTLPHPLNKYGTCLYLCPSWK